MPPRLLKLLDCVFLLRVPLLVPVWTVLLLGWATAVPGVAPFAVSPGPGTGTLLLCICGFSLVVMSIYVTNQIADIEGDRLNHKLFILPQGLVSIRTAWLLAGACAAGGLLVSAALPRAFAVLFAASLALGVLYNLRPFSLKDRAWGGVVANTLGHGMLTYLAGWLAGWFAVHGGTVIDRASLLQGILSSLAASFANGAVYLATTVPDADGDRATGKSTFCVRYGTRTTAVAATLMCLASLAACPLITSHAWMMALPAGASLGLFVWQSCRVRREWAFHTFRIPVMLLSLAVFVMAPWYLVPVLITFLASRWYYRVRFGIEYPTLKPK